MLELPCIANDLTSLLYVSTQTPGGDLSGLFLVKRKPQGETRLRLDDVLKRLKS